MTSLVFLLFLSPQLIVSTRAMQDSALYRNIVGGFSVGKFEQNQFSYLSVKNLASSMATDMIDCTFLCVGEPKCYSFNMAVSPDSNGLYLCELLATDKYRSKTKFHANATFHYYSPKTPCESDPCLSGDCVPDYELNAYHCECKQGFCRSHCEQENKTCSTIKSCNPHCTSGLYAIDPDGKGGVKPFKVFCDMADKNGVGVTVVSHDRESRTQVVGYELRGQYERNVSYTGAGLTSVAQLTRLTDVSAHCEQFIKYDCYHTLLLNNGDSYGWWVSRDGEKMKYWGGSHYFFPYKCACGLNGTCARKSDGCNCDINDYVWREDSGLLTNKSHLPVIQLRFGDTGDSGETGNHTLGKLKCWGME